MRRGDFAAAWRLSDARLGDGARDFSQPRHLQAIWTGAPLEGKRVLVRCYHGLGDTVQFIRFAPMLKQVAREVIVWAQPALLGLLRTADGIDRLLPLHDGAPEVEYDADVEIMELAHVFRVTPDTVAAAVPYLHAEPAGLAEVSRGRFNVGLVWQAGDWDERRSVPLGPLVAALKSVPEVRLHALQRGPALADWREEYGAVAGDDDPARAAAVMQALDAIVTVDSFPAHLAGALGRPTWTLLHSEPDWRWMDDRADSPWYPTMRLIRQDRAGEWGPVVTQLVGELSALVFDCQVAQHSTQRRKETQRPRKEKTEKEGGAGR